MIQLLTRCFTRTTRSMSRALITLTLAVLTALSLSTTTHANVDRVTYLHYDGLGSAIAATDEQGAIQWRENYQPYGQRTKYEATNHSVWFTGKPEEEDFALQYYGGRWYDPNLGRFNSIDPQGFVESSPMSFNRYAYGNNNPYSYVDPDGELPFLVPLAIFLVKEAAAEVASHYTDGWSDFLSVRRMATSGLRHARNALRRGGDVPRGVETPWGIADQATDAASMAARGQVQGGATLYRIGTTGKSPAAEAQFWSLENPLSPGYAQRYGIPDSNIRNANFIETATLKSGTPFVTRPAPAIGSNAGGGIEVVVPENGVKMRAFNYGGMD